MLSALVRVISFSGPPRKAAPTKASETAVSLSEAKSTGLKTGYYKEQSVDDGEFREVAGRGVRNPEHNQGAIVVGSDAHAAMGVSGL